MHYFEDQKISFNYNSDCSGNVHIRDGRIYESLVYVPPACRNCSNHPVNGGSGICNCILGSANIS